jgi:signal transduction histidine kinase
MLTRWVRHSLVAAATAIAIYSLIMAATADPDSGVGLAEDESTVSDVLPGSPVWRDGIREGDTVIELRDGSSSEGWQLLAQGPGGVHLSLASSHLAQLRQTAPIAFLGAVLTFAASVLLMRRSRLGAALLPFAVAIASVPLLLTGNLRDLVLGGSGALLVAGAAVVSVAPQRAVARVGAGVCVLMAAAWLLSIRAVPGAYDVLDAARLPVMTGATLIGMTIVIDRRRLLTRLAAPSGPNPVDLVYLPGTLALALVGLLVLDLPVLLVATIAMVLLLLYPSARRGAARVIEHALIGDVRRRTELRAIEQERGRLAREIHDAPLQELAAVIRRLDARPDTPVETAALRQVAAQLRDVVTTLRPPVLEDLGLVAALEDLGDAVAESNPSWQITVQIDDLQDPNRRLDEDVETAVFRIAQQACANAIQHSSGQVLKLEGSVASEAIDLAFVDDGPGVATTTPASARRLGHFGLDSMRERAASVGGSVDIERGAGSYVVRFRWEASE